MGARVLDPAEVDALAAVAFDGDGRVRMEALGRSCVDLAGAGRLRRRPTGDKVLLAPLPSDLDELAAHPLVREKLMPVLGLVRSPSVEHAIAACDAGHRARRPRPHLGGLRDRRRRSSSRFARAHPHRAASSSTRRPRSARSAASTTR